MGGEVAGSNIDGYVSNLENKRIDLFDRGTKGCGEDNVLLAPYEVTVDGCYLLVQTVQDTINVGTETAAALKDQMELALMAASNTLVPLVLANSMALILLDDISMILYGYISAAMTNQQLVDSGNRMMDETDQAIERSKKLVNPNNKDIRDIPGLAPPAMTRKLLWSAS
ncbi:novel plant SNARE 11-like [Quercus lobata]|uniref:novel plant SNARE 11-like n=1 Tax=Quercus lobata TaxID=97700 RepID=UPI001245C04A|nr:novel plant SNARE 11-like [Quercus lobata]